MFISTPSHQVDETQVTLVELPRIAQSGGASHHQRAISPVPEPFASIYRSSLAANLFERQVSTVVLKLANYPYLHLIVLENP
jgi:hypothetical protein